MTNQEKKAYLSRYRVNERQIARIRQELRRWKAAADGLAGRDYARDRVSSSGGDRLQAAVEQMDGLREQLSGQLMRRIRLRKEIELAIASVGDDTLSLLLHYRYIDGYTWERIAVEMNYSIMQIYRLHGQALSRMSA